MSAPELSSHDRILLSARALFAEGGYENTTTSQIARNAGTSESQLIKHFGSKEGLLEAIFEQAWKGLAPAVQPVLASSRTPREKLTDVIDLMFQALESDPEMRVLFLLEGRRIRRHGHVVVLTRGFTRMVTVVDTILREMREAGQLREDLHPEAVRSALIGAFEGLLRDRLLAERADYPAGYGREDMRETFRAVLAGFLTTP
ncbi:MAG TPA: TetR/AcrR family transcriptional regulator [Thermoanaerobaculia bacterium]|nr:TetR/AcrR family transcriptional regulator [Thermoanaerobaculia bacterium]